MRQFVKLTHVRYVQLYIKLINKNLVKRKRIINILYDKIIKATQKTAF
jgi:hypothetical protein